MTLAAGTQLGPYEVAAPLGAGGMGEVYRARDTKLGRDVALKVLPEAMAADPQRMGRFEREARTLASLNHPNIAAIHGLEETSGVCALVMELVEGETLQERIARASSSRTSSSGNRKGLQPEDCLQIAKQIAEALEYAHERSVIHRDLKPANVKITPEGTVKVLDFGLAKVLSNDDSASMDPSNSPTLSAMATQEGIILGTAAYMAPEQAKGKQVDRRADIWAFGCVLYEMLAGRKPFEGETISDILASVIKSDPDWTALPETTPPPMQKLLRRCLEKDARQRLRDIGEARIAIERTLSGAGPDAETAISGGQPAEGGRRSLLRRALPWALAVSTIAAVLFGGTTAWFMFQPKHRQNVMRFTVAGSGIVLLHQQGLSISPDGRTLAFIAQAGPGEPSVLWLRPLDSLTAHQIPETEGAHLPFWSPDSRSIGFFANGSLETVAVSGGMPQTICKSFAFGAGATWNRDGTILFSDTRSIYRVPATGGTPKVVVSSHAPMVSELPQFLPDGRHFLFLTTVRGLADVNWVNGGVVKVGSLDSSKTVPLLEKSSYALYAAPGYLLYAQGGNLMARGFDAKNLKFTGQAVLVNEDVQTGEYGYAQFSVSQNGALVYRTGVSAMRVAMTWFDRRGQKVGAVGQPGIYGDPEISPDGNRLAVVAPGSGTDTTDIWVYDLKRGTGSRLTFAPASNSNPLWQSDGKRIFFSSTRDGKSGIYEKSADGLGNAQLVFQSDKQQVNLDAVSPDGHYALYMSPSPTNAEWAVPLTGKRTPFGFLQGNFVQERARFSPNGRYIAYMSTETGEPEVYVQTFPEHQGKWQISTAGGDEPMWRSDGKELFYLSRESEVMAVNVNMGPGGFQAGTPKPLFKQVLSNVGSWRNSYAVSPDGQRFLMLAPPSETKPSPITVVLNWPELVKK